MVRIIRNKLIVKPKNTNNDEYSSQLTNVALYCQSDEEINGIKREISFAKIAPKPTTLVPESKEEDDWLLNNWGTRNKAFHASWISDNELIFDTYWRPALPIILKIIRHFPNIDFEYKYASDKTGYNTGILTAVNGKLTITRHVDKTKKAFEVAFELRPHLYNMYTLNMLTDTYEYDISDIANMVAENGFYKECDGTLVIHENGADGLPF